MTSIAPHHEPEVLAARNLRTIAERGLPEGWLNEDQTTAILVSNTIERAIGHAERAFLGSIGMPPTKANTAVTSIIGDMFADARRAADLLALDPEQRSRLELEMAHLFDRRLAILRASAVQPWRHA